MTYRHLMAASLALAVAALCACDSKETGDPKKDATSSPDLPVTTDTSGPPADVDTTKPLAHTMTESLAFKWSIPAAAPTPNASCAAPDAGIYGPHYAWQGFVYDDKTYTCNTCPGGVKSLQGPWRAIFDPNGNDPTIVWDKDATYKERLTLDGNTFEMVLDGQDEGAPKHAVVKGWFWCGDHAEVNNNSKWLVVTSAVPSGAFGYEAGLVFTADLLYSEPAGLMMGYYASVQTQGGTSWAGTQPYCRIGLNSDGKPCTDPFAP